MLLLVLAPAWCRATETWLAQVAGHPEVALALQEGALATHADSEARPDLAARFGQGAWPSVLLLDGGGEPVLAGVALAVQPFLDGLRGALARLRGGAPFAVPASPPAAPPTTRDDVLGDGALERIERTLLQDFDHRHGGFGSGPKFPRVEVLDFLLMRHVERRDQDLSEILAKTLAAQVGGGLHDALDGGFFRCAQERDWSRPVCEKTLDVNLGLARVLLGAGRHLDQPAFLACGAETLRFVLAELRDAESGLFWAGLGPDEAYFALDRASRRTRSRPRRDERLLADANARAVVALARGAALLDDERLLAIAREVLAALLQRHGRSGRGLLHVIDKSGAHDGDHLLDLAEALHALLAVHEATGDGRLLEPLGELVEGLLSRHLREDGQLGAPPGARGGEGLLATSVAAQALLRCSALLLRDELRGIAVVGLLHHARDHRRHAEALGPFGRALAMALRPAARVAIVGPADDGDVAALRRTACRTPVTERVLLPLDPRQDGERLAALGLPTRPAPRAYVLREHEAVGAADSPAALAALLARAAERRRADAPEPLELD